MVGGVRRAVEYRRSYIVKAPRCDVGGDGTNRQEDGM